MPTTVRAIYENGVLRPLEPLGLSEHQIVTVAVADDALAEPWLDHDCFADCVASPDAAASDVDLETVRAALATIPGSLTCDFIAERDDR